MSNHDSPSVPRLRPVHPNLRHLKDQASGAKSLADSLKEIHETIGTIGYWLIGLHAAVALFHHYVMRDNTLVRMLPRRA